MRLFIPLILTTLVWLPTVAEAGDPLNNDIATTAVDAEQEALRKKVIGRWNAQYDRSQQRQVALMDRAIAGQEYTDDELETLRLTDDEFAFIAMVSAMKDLVKSEEQLNEFKAKVATLKTAPSVTFKGDQLVVQMGAEEQVLTYELSELPNGAYNLKTVANASGQKDEVTLLFLDNNTIRMMAGTRQVMKLRRASAE